MSQITDQVSSEIFNRKPYLRNYFQNWSTSGQWDIIPAKEESQYYVSYNGEALSSKFSPDKQAERLLDSHNLKPTDVVLLMGLGNPHLIQRINTALRPGQIFVMIGDDPALIDIMWDQVLKDTLKIPGRHIFSGEAFLPLGMNYLESLPIDRVSGLKIIRNQSDVNREQLFYSETEGRIQSVFSAKMSDLLTKFEFERLWVKNSIWNLLQVSQPSPERFKISSLKEQFSGLSALLVSAGPSLRKNLKWIHRIRDKVFILSCDTSLKVLLKEGIIPDGVVTLDAQTNSFFHFMGEDLNPIPLFADLVSSPTLLREPMFRSVIHSVTAKFQVDAEGNLIREVTAGGELADSIFEEVGDIQSGGSVATTAFDMLRYMGFTDLYFVGQDLAYSGREIHSTGTHHNEKWLTQVTRRQSLERINEVIIRKRETKEVPSCNGKTVLTDYVLELYRHWFEESARSVDLKLVNLNGDGALIEGFENVDPEKGIQSLLLKPNHNYPWRKKDPWLVALSGKESGHDTKLVNKSKELFQQISNDLKFIENELLTIEKENTEEFDLLTNPLWIWVQNQLYLRRMVRKTEIYLLRHKDLSPERKNNLLTGSLRRELKYLKRSLYPMSELLSTKG
ncbi:motility associated factor glycosyltransferase family protein [Leptospira sp. 'Mane']|uniref:motility associated factor glycosyltransferase family protein n=1 Tax=Leptospira sp. 'Mane' TaxID=3387407 RepID=UPI00398A5663